MKILHQKSQKTLPYLCYYIPVILLVIAGIADTVYLSLTHYYNYTDLSFASFCAISKAINCDTVAQSPWSIFFNLPVSQWGLFGYLLFFFILVPLRKNTVETRPLWGILFLLALAYSLVSIYFGYISSRMIHAYCLLCIFSYGINFTLLFCCFIIRRRFSNESLFVEFKKSLKTVITNKRFRILLIPSILYIVIMMVFVPSYWEYEIGTSEGTIHTGVTVDGSPWIGAVDPVLTIEEFTDYQCFQCAKMHHFLRMIISERPDKIRLVHHHYPMDNTVNPYAVPEPFHIGSAKLALVAIAAQHQDKFWRTNDLLYKEVRSQKKAIDIAKIAEEASLDIRALQKALNSQTSLKKLEADIRKGLRHNITGTPTFIIEGETYTGTIPSQLLDPILQL